MDETEVYRNSMSFAVGNREKDLWRASYRANWECAVFIRKTLAENFDGMHLSDGCLQTILDAYGFNRVMWVLANTVGKGKGDGRYYQRMGKNVSYPAGLPQFGVLCHFPPRNRKRVGG